MAANEFTAPDTMPDDMARQTAQAELLRSAKEKLGVTTAELAELLGTNRDTLNGWLAAKASSRYREMPLTAKLLLAYRLKYDKPKRGRK